MEILSSLVNIPGFNVVHAEIRVVRVIRVLFLQDTSNDPAQAFQRRPGATCLRRNALG